MVDSTGSEPDRIRDRDTRARAVRDDDQAVEPEEIATPVRLRVEARAEPSRSGTNQRSSEPSTSGARKLRAKRVQEALHGPFERLQRHVAGEAVGDDDVRV